MGSVLVERNAAIQNTKAIFRTETYEAILRSPLPAKLVAIANEQQRLLAA